MKRRHRYEYERTKESAKWQIGSSLLSNLFFMLFNGLLVGVYNKNLTVQGQCKMLEIANSGNPWLFSSLLMFSIILFV